MLFVTNLPPRLLTNDHMHEYWTNYLAHFSNSVEQVYKKFINNKWVVPYLYKWDAHNVKVAPHILSLPLGNMQ